MARYIAMIDEKTDGSSLEMTEYKTITEAAEAASNLWSRLTKTDKKDRRIMAGFVDRDTSDIIRCFWTSETEELTEDDIIDAGMTTGYYDCLRKRNNGTNQTLRRVIDLYVPLGRQRMHQRPIERNKGP